MRYEEAAVTTVITLGEALAAIERIVEQTEYPTLIDADVPDRLEAVGRKIRERVEAKRKEPRTCGECGVPIHLCECN